jgi:hypothetical protein
VRATVSIVALQHVTGMRYQSDASTLGFSPEEWPTLLGVMHLDGTVAELRLASWGADEDQAYGMYRATTGEMSVRVWAQ